MNTSQDSGTAMVVKTLGVQTGVRLIIIINLGENIIDMPIYCTVLPEDLTSHSDLPVIQLLLTDLHSAVTLAVT